MKNRYLILMLLISVSFLSGKRLVIKMATLAPEGSDWHGQLVEMGQLWSEATDGQIILRIYPGGVVGDEKDMIRKMRIGQIHAAAITSEGLAEINRDFSAFFMPMLYEDWEDVDYIRERLSPELEKGLEDNGFKLLYMADIGWVYWFTKDKIIRPEELKEKKIFTWAGDYRTAALWKKSGFNPIPLASIDIMAGLQTGLINAVASPPIYALAQQWFGILNHMLAMRWGLLSAGIIIDNRVWKRISPNHQKAILMISKKVGKNIQRKNRLDEDKAVQVMKEYGLIVNTLTPDQYSYWKTLVKTWYPNIRGTVVTEKIFDKVVRLKAEKDSLDLLIKE